MPFIKALNEPFCKEEATCWFTYFCYAFGIQTKRFKHQVYCTVEAHLKHRCYCYTKHIPVLFEEYNRM